MEPSKFDLSLFFRVQGGCTKGVVGTHVDDSVITGDSNSEEERPVTLFKYKSRSRKYNHTTCAGVDIKAVGDGFELSHPKHIERLKVLPTDCFFSDFKSNRAPLEWVVHVMSEISFDFATAAQKAKKINSQ